MPSRSPRSSSATACSPSRPLTCADGFTLLEVIVALAILGIGLGVVFQGISQGLRLRGESEDNIRISQVAERQLGALVEREAAPASLEEGEESGCRWRLEPGADSASPSSPGEAASSSVSRGHPLVEVRLKVTAASGRGWETLTLLPREKETAP